MHIKYTPIIELCKHILYVQIRATWHNWDDYREIAKHQGYSIGYYNIFDLEFSPMIYCRCFGFEILVINFISIAKKLFE